MTRTHAPRLLGAATGLALLGVLGSGCSDDEPRAAAGGTSSPTSATTTLESPSDSPSAGDPETGEEDVDLQAATEVVSQALQDFHDQQAAFPRRVRLAGDTSTHAGGGGGSSLAHWRADAPTTDDQAAFDNGSHSN
jgi:hypothetical protein